MSDTFRDLDLAVDYGPDDDRLARFYIPVLSRSRHYARSTGFFSSQSLARAAVGVARLIGNGGQMRMLCGAQLDPQDVEAISRGSDLAGTIALAMDRRFSSDLADDIQKQRLEVLAWMVAKGTLEIRVVLPRDEYGRPLGADEARDYYHPKEAVFTDAEGNRIAFNGSVNESETGWARNYETFTIYTDFERTIEGHRVNTRPHLEGVARRFEELWEGRREDWIALPLPEAARQRLLRLVPNRAPDRDPEEVKPSAARPVSAGRLDQLERLRFSFLRDAPRLAGGEHLGMATAGVSVWPHQRRVVEDVVRRFPQSFLFCDEVGLGKTIEAGMALRQLVLSRQVRRALILAPSGVLRQWQEELQEKFALAVMRYDGRSIWDPFGNRREAGTRGVWEGFPLLLASSQLARRPSRRTELLEASGWDLVIVDEAHHARRREFDGQRYRPNRLLQLLEGGQGLPGLREKCRALFLLTATPMQVHPVEVWDLLRLLGLAGRWGASERAFLRYYAELRKPPEERDWDFVLDMVREDVRLSGGFDPRFLEQASRELDLVQVSHLRELPGSERREALRSALDLRGQAMLERMVRLQTPLRRFVWRNTRDLLRRYRERGLIDAVVPVRAVENEWIDLSPEERQLYDDVETYISDFYRRYEARRAGLGFVMTIYRRRLTSSFYALEQSLRRRLEFLSGRLDQASLFSEEDLDDPRPTGEDDAEGDPEEPLGAEARTSFEEEVSYLHRFVEQLRWLGSDSKWERLSREVRELTAGRGSVIVFTQYTDTMDYLREKLRTLYGRQVACYSGRGGEKWNGEAWIAAPKEEIKREFRSGDSLKVLLCTESASEGLNLQTCGVLINYDMPWNPMRVEQRIGRIDRIGQTYEEVWIRNFFYSDTVEATIYQRLEDRIDWFQSVVGRLQPILHGLEAAIRRAAMAAPSQRQQALEAELERLRREDDEKSEEDLGLDEIEDAAEVAGPIRPPATLTDLQDALLGSPRTAQAFREPHPEIPNAFLVEGPGGGNVGVTFDPDLVEAHPGVLELMTWGTPRLDELLGRVPEPRRSSDERGLARVALASDQVRWWAPRTPEPEAIERYTDLVAAAGRPADALHWHPAASTVLERWKADAERDWCDRERDQRALAREAILASLTEETRSCLVRAAVLQFAENWPEGDLATLLRIGDASLDALRGRGRPFRGLVVMLQGALQRPLGLEEGNDFLLELRSRDPSALRRHWLTLQAQGEQLLNRWAALQGPAADSAAPSREGRISLLAAGGTEGGGG